MNNCRKRTLTFSSSLAENRGGRERSAGRFRDLVEGELGDRGDRSQNGRTRGDGEGTGDGARHRPGESAQREHDGD